MDNSKNICGCLNEHYYWNGRTFISIETDNGYKYVYIPGNFKELLDEIGVDNSLQIILKKRRFGFPRKLRVMREGDIYLPALEIKSLETVK